MAADYRAALAEIDSLIGAEKAKLEGGALKRAWLHLAALVPLHAIGKEADYEKAVNILN